MAFTSTKRSLWLMWFVVFALWIAILIYPVSFRATRYASLTCFLLTWFGLIALTWKYKPLRIVLLTFTVLASVLLIFPSKKNTDVIGLRADYLSALRRYENVRYYWGGETSRGIDCSGLVRQGLIDASFKRGVLGLDPGLLRQSLSLWWNDCTASALGEGHRNLTLPQTETPSLNVIDTATLLPGDLAVTSNGVHVMAYLGNNEWIEADPGDGKVIRVTPPSKNPWFNTPMKIVRWRTLQPDAPE